MAPYYGGPGSWFPRPYKRSMTGSGNLNMSEKVTTREAIASKKNKMHHSLGK